MVVDDVLDVRNVKTSRSQVGGHQHIGRAITEAIQLFLALMLFQTAVETTNRESLVLQIVAYAFYGIAIVQEYDAALVPKTQQQLLEGAKLVFLGTMHLIQGDTFGGLFLFWQEINKCSFFRHVDESGNLIGIGGRKQYATL